MDEHYIFIATEAKTTKIIAISDMFFIWTIAIFSLLSKSENHKKIAINNMFFVWTSIILS